MLQDCTAIILTGGASTRMGCDKANVLLGEQTLLQHVVAAMQQTFPHLILSVREPRPEFDIPQVCDIPNVSGPLAGILAAWPQLNTPWAFIVACDMPYLSPELIATLARYRDTYQAVVAVAQGHAQPLAAFYRHDVGQVLHRHLSKGGKPSLRAVFGQLAIRYVAEHEWSSFTSHSFVDLDTPQDLSDAKNSFQST